MNRFTSFVLLTGFATASFAATTTPSSLSEALAQGKFSLNARLRYEGVQQTALRDADALTLRSRLGFAPAAWRGWSALVEAENIVAFDGDAYSQAGLNPGGAGRAVVADPESTELNQLFLGYTRGSTTTTVGRQRLVLDNARFVGDVGWRQNMQTFDAIVVQDKTLTTTTLTYAYLDRVNRVFGDKHAQGKWSSESHVFNASYRGFKPGVLTGYAYLLDFKDAAVNSCATYGLSFAGTKALSKEWQLAYRAELATQSDYGRSALNYTARYAALSAGLTGQPGSITLGYEELGTDRNVGFKTPLATLHAFNGWADLFLATPAAGLRDGYLLATAKLPAGTALTVAYHRFTTDAGGRDLGDEINAQLSRKFGRSINALVKWADFRSDSASYPDVRKLWAQVEFTY